MQTWYFGAIDRETKDFFIVEIPDRSKRTLLPLIHSMIIQGSTINSDSWSSYKSLEDEWYFHYTVNHRKRQWVSPSDPEVNTQRIENTWSGLKRFLRKQGSHKCENIGLYMSEYFWRKKMKISDQDIFQQALSLVSIIAKEGEEEFEEITN